MASLQCRPEWTARPGAASIDRCGGVNTYRLGEEFHDLDDVRYLLRYLNVSTLEEALAIALCYFDEEHILPKTRLALEELLCG